MPIGSAIASAMTISIPVVTNAGRKVMPALPDSPNKNSMLILGSPLTSMNIISDANAAATATTQTMLKYLRAVQPLPLLRNTGADAGAACSEVFTERLFPPLSFFGLRAMPIPKFNASTITRSTLPVAIRACLCSPSAYPISATILIVSVRMLENSPVGKSGTLPATIMTAIVSPTALPSPSTRPVTIPDLAAGTVTLNIACCGVAPRASAPS